MRKSFGLAMAFALLAAGSAHATIFTQWNFNSLVPDANTGTGTLLPSVGAGTASVVGGPTSSFASGDASGGSSDPAVGDDSGWGLTGWATQGTDSGTRGAEFAASTVGWQAINFTFDLRTSNTASRFLQVSYSLDGSTFSSVGLASDGIFSSAGGDTWNNLWNVDFTSIAGADNNPDFKVRVLAVFDPTSAPGAYVASNPGSNYATTGTYRLDMVTFSGDVVPEPGTLGMLAVGAMALIRRRKR